VKKEIMKNNQPLMGTMRTTEKFLWLPQTIGNETRWLRTVKFREIYWNNMWNFFELVN